MRAFVRFWMLISGLWHCDATEITFPSTPDLVRLLNHALRWQYQWQIEAGQQPVFRATVSQALSSRSILITLGLSHQIWSFIPAAGVHIIMVQRLSSGSFGNCSASQMARITVAGQKMWWNAM